MEGLKEFFIHNWQLVASATLFILATVIGLIRTKKKGGNILGYLLGLIWKELPEWVKEAEVKGGTSEQKKVWVLNKSLNYASKQLGRKLSEEETSFFVANTSEQIEKVLDAPQKKQGKEEVKTNVKYR